MTINRFRLSVVLISCALAYFLYASVVSAATVYVDSSLGNDTTGNGSSGTPYKTFHKGYASASASDTVDLTGTFTWTDSDETGDTAGSGYTLSKNLTFQGHGTSTTIIQASSTANTADRSVFTNNATVTFKNLTIRNGVTTSGTTGGGITNNGTLTIQSALMTTNKYNTSSYYGGGAIFNNQNSVLTIATSTISNNIWNGYLYGSGGIFSTQSTTITINGSTFANNSATGSNPSQFAYSYAEPSGAIGVFRFVTTIITNSTFSDNSTNAYGGALQVYYPNSFKITNTTIANNTASLGAGGILFESVTGGYNLHVKNTILANNIGNSTANDFYVVSGSAGMITDNGYNIVETSTNKTWSGTGNITGDQVNLNLSATLADNSATNGVQTLALTSGSVAIDAGNTTANSSISIPTFDQRGGTRNGATDIGAVEYGAGGIADTAAPSVSVTAPSSGATVSGTTSLTASATDNVAIAGVSFYIDGILQGSEDTASPFVLSWDSMATSTGSHSVSAVARDTSTNYATSTSVLFIVDNTSPILLSITVATTSSAATIVWTTDEAASTKINFGLTSSYGTSTAETDTSSRVTNHEAALSGLASCAQYHYQAQSKDAMLNTGTSTDATFTTAGCTGSAGISSVSQQDSIAIATGGILTNGDLTLTVPISFTATSSSVTFQSSLLDSASFFATAGTPSGVNQVGNNVFNLKALIDATTTLSIFSSALSVTLAYTASDIIGVNESSLAIYRYDGSSWYALSGCSVDTSARAVTCTTTAFSDFALFGQTATAVSSSSSSGGNGPIFMGSAASLPGYVPPRAQTIYSDGTIIYGDISATTSTTSRDTEVTRAQLPEAMTASRLQASSAYPFTRTLRANSMGEDVKELQKFLNRHGFPLAPKGVGSLGNETIYFGPMTYNALVKFQETNAIDILIPLNITRGTGIFAELTRNLVHVILTRER